MPGGGRAEPEQDVEVALFVDNDAHVPVTAHAHDPAFRCLGRGMRDGDEVYVLVVGGKCGERLEGLFGNYGEGRREAGVSKSKNRNGREVQRGREREGLCVCMMTYRDSHNAAGKL